MQLVLQFCLPYKDEGWVSQQCIWVFWAALVTVLVVTFQTDTGIYTSVTVFGCVSHFWKPDKFTMKSWNMMITPKILLCYVCGKYIRVTNWNMTNECYISCNNICKCFLYVWYPARRYVRHKICKTKQPQVDSPK